jgi:hypothetical protein
LRHEIRYIVPNGVQPTAIYALAAFINTLASLLDARH